MIKFYWCLIGMFCTLTAVYAVTGNCDKENVNVNYTDKDDYTMACNAINTINRVFNEFGFVTEDYMNIHFQEKVALSIPSLEQSTPIEEIQVYALYDAPTNNIYITSYDTPYIRSRKAFNNLDVTPSLHESIIVHELAHRYLHLYYRDVLQRSNPDHATHEFFAYTIQIESLNPSDKQNVLSLWPDSTFSSDMGINSMIHGAHPHKFGVMAYRYSSENNTLSNILEGTFLSGDEILANFM